MSPSSTSEARKRREGAPDPGPTPLAGYILTTRGEAGRAGWECIDIDDVEEVGADGPERIAEAAFKASDDTISSWLVIARPPRPRTVTIELPADSAERWAEQTWTSDDLTAITAACRASRDAEQ